MAKPQFTRKFYILVSDALRYVQTNQDVADHPAIQHDDFTLTERIAIALCEKFGADNPQFNWYQFLTACGLDAAALLGKDEP